MSKIKLEFTDLTLQARTLKFPEQEKLPEKIKLKILKNAKN